MTGENGGKKGGKGGGGGKRTSGGQQSQKELKTMGKGKILEIMKVVVGTGEPCSES